MKPHYYAYKSKIREKNTYCLLPISGEAVFVDGLYYPDEKFLLLLSKDTRDRFQMVPRINDFGDVVYEKGKEGKMRQDRLMMNSNYEYYIHESQNIRWFAENYVTNATEFIEFLDSTEVKQ